MLIERIKTHNTINGIVFSTLEFSFIALFLLPFVAYYMIHQEYFFALVASGIFLNCFPIICIGVTSWKKKEKSFGISALFKSNIRNKLQKKYPHMLYDTLIIVLTTLIPFLALCISLLDVL